MEIEKNIELRVLDFVWGSVDLQGHIHNCRTDSNFLLRFLRMQKHRVSGCHKIPDAFQKMQSCKSTVISWIVLILIYCALGGQKLDCAGEISCHEVSFPFSCLSHINLFALWSECMVNKWNLNKCFPGWSIRTISANWTSESPQCTNWWVNYEKVEEKKVFIVVRLFIFLCNCYHFKSFEVYTEFKPESFLFFMCTTTL